MTEEERAARCATSSAGLATAEITSMTDELLRFRGRAHNAAQRKAQKQKRTSHRELKYLNL